MAEPKRCRLCGTSEPPSLDVRALERAIGVTWKLQLCRPCGAKFRGMFNLPYGVAPPPSVRQWLADPTAGG